MNTEIKRKVRIRLSEEESTGLGYKIGRAFLGEIDVVDLKQQIYENGFQILRLRVDESVQNAKQQLQLMGFPVAEAGNIVKYRFELAGFEMPEFLYADTKFVTYDGSQSSLVKDIVMKGCSADPIGYYRTPPLNELIGKQREVEYMAHYFATTFLTPERQLWLQYYNGEPVGFLANTISNGVLDTPLAVVYPDKRGKKFLHEIMISRNRYGLEHGLTAITNGARMENPATNHVFDKFGMKRDGVDCIFHVINV